MSVYPFTLSKDVLSHVVLPLSFVCYENLRYLHHLVWIVGEAASCQDMSETLVRHSLKDLSQISPQTVSFVESPVKWKIIWLDL